MRLFRKYFGKYRGVVVDNVDPMQMGRLQIMAPTISTTKPIPWALPCLPFAGIQSGFFVVPPIGAGVWVEFEQGNQSYPIWSGGFWAAAGEVPAIAAANPPPLQTVVLQTSGGNVLTISDQPGPSGGILLKTAAGAMMSISDAGVTISNGQGATITLTGSSVSVSEGALTSG